MRQQTTTKATRKRRAERKREDEGFIEWVRTQPSALTGNYSEWVNGEGRNPACHIKRAATGGTAFKPKFACIPLTHEEHAYQHQHGEAACLTRFLGGTWTRETAADWFDHQAEHHRKIWEEQNA